MVKYTEEVIRTRITAEIKEILRKEGKDPDVRPQPIPDWLRKHEISGIEAFAQRKNMSVVEVLEEVCGFEPPPEKPLGIRHRKTRKLVNDWLEDEEQLYNTWSSGRVGDAKSHFRTIADACRERLGTTNLLRIIDGEKETAVSECKLLFSELNDRLGDGTFNNYTRSLERWAEEMVMDGVIEGQVVTEVDGRFDNKYPRESPEYTLNLKQQRRLWKATETLEEKVVFILLVTSGLRRREPTDLKIEDLRLDRSDPYIVFYERKSDSATAPVMAGVEILEEWCDYLATLEYNRKGWLLPSKDSKDGSRSKGWVNNIYEDLVERAGVTFPDGEQPTPKHARSFWYNWFMKARLAWLRHIDYAADAQGVSSSKIINEHYLVDELERDHFRMFARECFAEVFGDLEIQNFETVLESREVPDNHPQSKIDDFVSDAGAQDSSSSIEAAGDNDETDEPGSPPSSILTPIGFSSYSITRLSKATAKQAKREYQAMGSDPTVPDPTASHLALSLCMAIGTGIILGLVVTPESLPNYLFGGVIGGLMSIHQTDMQPQE